MTRDLFAPVALGPVMLRNRTVKAATFEGCSPEGRITSALTDFHLAAARGGVGLTTVASLAVSADGRSRRDQIVVGPGTATGLAQLADAVHQTGARVAGQITHSGPVSNERIKGRRPLAASRTAVPFSWARTGAATERDLTRITRSYVATARTLVYAGFDVLELQFAHSHLISSFLAPGLNRRRDRWGGSLENRARLARQVARAVRDEVGGECAVIARWSLDDGFEGGQTPEQSVAAAQLLESDGSLDALLLTAGSALVNPMFIMRGPSPETVDPTAPWRVRVGLRTPYGRTLRRDYDFVESYLSEQALAMRRGVALPLMLVGGVNRLETMQWAMSEGFDFVALGRALLREPDLINRLAAGHVTEGSCVHRNKCLATLYGRTYCPEVQAETASVRLTRRAD